MVASIHPENHAHAFFAALWMIAASLTLACVTARRWWRNRQLKKLDAAYRRNMDEWVSAIEQLRPIEEVAAINEKGHEILDKMESLIG